MELRLIFKVSIVDPGGVLYEGEAQSVVFPGTNGTFEILINHKPLLSRLRSGDILVDNKAIPIRQGVVKAALNQVLAIVEAAA
ncbi:MAG: hypothetical protein WC352_05880 [Candidatus Omnitrophota bacterium]|jgi:F-type H+-transporting ATPase subunit epsilon